MATLKGSAYIGGTRIQGPSAEIGGRARGTIAPEEIFEFVHD